ncbi:MAG: hypothetical protein A2Y38_16330 [Spirochaetes bacterium GWB1_59_5]|nr:MAG: hypothetical protein A2Y38_16330 [Spirochaetes bacterium GWB1_59_5]
MEEIVERADKWIVEKYRMADAVPQADKIIQGLLLAWENEKHLSERLFERATRAESKAKRLADDALTALAGIVCTPVEGYLEAPQCLSADIRNLRKLEEAATKRAISAEKGWEEALQAIKDGSNTSDLAFLSKSLMESHRIRFAEGRVYNMPLGDCCCDSCKVAKRILKPESV